MITVLDAKGRPTPVVAARLIPPASRMAPLTPEELQADIRQSDLLAEYDQSVDRESAREMLAKRMAATEARAELEEPRKGRGVAKTAAKAAGVAVVGALTSTIGRTVGREIVRGLFGLLGMTPPRTTRRTRSRW